MAQVTLKGNPIHTLGDLPAQGDQAPNATLTKTDLSDVQLKDYADKTVILNIFPSVDTGTCAASVRRFNEEASNLDGVEVLCISADLPFAMQRFCGAEGIDRVTSLSAFRSDFGKQYGVQLTDGPLAGLMARSVVAIKNNEVIYTQLIPEITEEPDYEAALKAVS